MNINESGAFYMENKTEIEFTRNTRCVQTYTDTSAEYVLPDYNGDVRKILYTSAEVRPSGRFAGGDEVECSGIVVYEIVYIDSENKLTSVTFTSDYDYSVKCSGESYRDSFAETTVSNYAIRLVGPRKIAAKASLVGNVAVVESGKATVEGDSFCGDENPEVQSRRFKIRRSLSSESREREYAEMIARLDGAIADEVSVISTYADAVAEEVSVGDGEVTVRGNLTLSAIIKNGDMPAYQREKVVPFEESVPFPEAREGMFFVPEIQISSLTATINASEIGTEVVVSAVLEYSVVGETNEEGEIVTDSYLKACAVENGYEDFTYNELSSVIASRETESGSVQRADVEAEGIREILFLKAAPKTESVVNEGGRLCVKGELKYSGIASAVDADGAIGYVPLRFSVPFERSFEVKSCDRPSFEVHVKSHNASATFDAAKLYATCTVEVNVVTCEEKHIKRLASSRRLADHKFEKSDSRIVIYYPDKSETLFSIAKKYKSTVGKIASDNMLTADVMTDSDGNEMPINVKKLLIY